MFDDPYRTADAGTLPYDPQPYPRTPTHDVLAVLGGKAANDNNNRDAKQWALLLEAERFFSGMTLEHQTLVLELIEAARGTRYQSLRNDMIDIIEEITEEQP